MNLTKRYGFQPDVFSFAPGRINIIGEHTDYNRGWVLPAAIHLGVNCAIAAYDAAFIVFYLQFDKQIEITEVALADIDKPHENTSVHECLGLLEQFQRRGIVLSGMKLSFVSNLPPGIGLSFSAARLVALAVSLNNFYDVGFDKMTLARMSQLAEMQRRGVLVGIMDMFTSLFAEADRAILLDCNSMRWDQISVPSPPDYTWLLVQSGVKHNHAENGYSQRVEEVREALVLLQEAYPEVLSLRDVALDMLEVLHPNSIHLKRSKYVIEENDRVLQAVRLLESQNLPALGQVLQAGHTGLRDDYEVSCVEVDRLMQLSEAHPAWLGGRMMGGGFGGCTLNLVLTEGQADFEAWIEDKYQLLPATSPFLQVPFAAGASTSGRLVE